MIFNLPALTLIHVILSLVGLIAGLVVVGGMMAGNRMILPVAIAARYWKHLEGAWRNIYVITAVVALYLNVFVLIVQLFHRVPGLLVVAPTQQSPAFIVTQLLNLVLFILLGRVAVKGFKAA